MRVGIACLCDANRLKITYLCDGGFRRNLMSENLWHKKVRLDRIKPGSFKLIPKINYLRESHPKLRRYYRNGNNQFNPCFISFNNKGSTDFFQAFFYAFHSQGFFI